MVTKEDLAKFNFKPETDEEFRGKPPIFTGWPAPKRRYRLFVEGYNMSIEEPYFWVLHYLIYMHGFGRIDKISDIFAAAEGSSFFGSMQQRLGAQQDKVSQFLATVGKMVKELFQLVRELRVLDERVDYYTDSNDPKSRSRESAEITLKGIWVDMVEQGAKNPASVYGMAREVQFVTLPDLFFSTHPLKQEDVDDYVEEHCAQFNRKVREVLKRKLRSFVTWKEHTYEEIKNRRIFTLKYLRQHYQIIRMYMSWVRPYLKNVQRLHMDQSKMDTADLILAFETSMIEIEILGIDQSDDPKKPSPVINVHFWFRTRPELNYNAEGYQRGPIHVGRVQMNFRAYAWTEDEIKNYKRMKAEEDFRLIALIDESVKAAMESLGDELMRYLLEAGEEDMQKPVERDQKNGKKIETPARLAPYNHVYKGFNEMFKSFKPQVEKVDVAKLEKAKGEAEKAAAKAMWNTYHHFKKHHGMLNW